MTKSCLAESKNRRADISNTVPSECCKQSTITGVFFITFTKLTTRIAFQLAQSRQLFLAQKEEGPFEHGILGNLIGRGTYGAVFDVEAPGWSTHMDEVTVAKWFKYKNHALAEILNLRAIGELLYYGVSVKTPSRSLWAIMKKKRGFRLKHLPSRSYFHARNNEERCKAYMEDARNAIVAAHHSYMRMPGAPTHGSVC